MPSADPILLAELPKAELHLHIEGTLEPELVFLLASRNRITLPWPDVASLRRAYAFSDLQSFLDLYYAVTDVLRTEADFHDMTDAWIRRAVADNTRHAEIFFDPQSHTARGIPLETVFAGIARALRAARGTLSARMILCFLRHLPESDAERTLTDALALRDQYADLWVGVGLDSSERGHPPAKFARVFARARAAGLACVAHAGEEGPAACIEEALDVLGACRIDHGVRSADSPALLARLAREQIPLTVCPLSNLRLGVVGDLRQHPLRRLLGAGLCVTINADDPAYFGGYLLENYRQTAQALALDNDAMARIARNGFTASLLPETEKAGWLASIDRLMRQHPA
jgi:adenosine deaminase